MILVGVELKTICCHSDSAAIASYIKNIIIGYAAAALFFEFGISFLLSLLLSQNIIIMGQQISHSSADKYRIGNPHSGIRSSTYDAIAATKAAAYCTSSDEAEEKGSMKIVPHKTEKMRIKWMQSIDDFQSFIVPPPRSKTAGFEAFLDVSHESTVQKMIDLIKEYRCIRVAVFYSTDSIKPFQTGVIRAAQMGAKTIHSCLQLGNSVAFLEVTSERGLVLSQFPSGNHLWKTCDLPIDYFDIEKAVRIVVDTVLRCPETYYDPHTALNFQHTMCRLLDKKHPIFDKNNALCSDDYECEDCEGWSGLQCSQLVLLMLKRFVTHKVLKLERRKLAYLMSINSHTCLPDALWHLITENLWQGMPINSFDATHSKFLLHSSYDNHGIKEERPATRKGF